MTVLCASRKVGSSPGFPGGVERICLLKGDPLGPEDGEVLLIGSPLGLNLFGEPWTEALWNGVLERKIQSYRVIWWTGWGHSGIEYLPGIMVLWDIIILLAKNDHRNEGPGWQKLLETMLLGSESGSSLLDGFDSKESACNAGDPCSIPGSVRCSIVSWRIAWTEGAWQAIVHGVTKSQT